MNSTTVPITPAPACEPAAAPTTPAAARSGWVSAVPIVLVLLLAVVLAATPVHDSTVWRHLAAGRAWWGGNDTIGTDPFAYTTDGAVWVNHAWLFDVLLYGAYQLTGSALGIVQPLLALLLTGFMLLAARPRCNPWTAAFSVALALVALGPFLRLGPELVSYVLFAVVAWCLDRAAEPLSPRRRQWLLLVLATVSVLWVNSDDWFLLAPATVALFALGSLLTKAPGGGWLCGAVAVSLGACLVNPYHVHVFVLPAALQDMSITGEPAPSPLHVLSASSVAAVPLPLAAFGLLMLLSALSVFRGKRRSWPEVGVLVALAALSLWRSSAIPFFAVATGPFLARGWEIAPGTRRLAWLGPFATTAGLVGFVVLAATGWLQATGERRGWFLREDASLRQLAEQLAAWHEDGRLPEPARGFNYSVDAAHYVEWFCPGVRVFIDSRPHLYPPEVVADFREVRRLLAQTPQPSAPQSAVTAVRPILERRRVSYLIVSDPVERTLLPALWNLWQTPADWALVSLTGNTTVFAARTAPPGTVMLTVPPLNLERPGLPPSVLDTVLPAPPTLVGAPPWWDCLARPEVAAAERARGEALIHLAHFEALQPAFARHRIFAWQTKLALAALVPPTGTPGVMTVVRTMPAALLASSQQPVATAGPSLLGIVQLSVAAEQQRGDDGPPGTLLLAVRAARRALAADPTNALAYLRLGHAYERLDARTSERASAAGFPLLSELRRVQAITALKHALKLQPDLLPAHRLLAGLYDRAGALDLALEHLQEMVRLSRAAGPRPGESHADFTVRVDGLAASAQQLARLVRERLNLATAKSFNLQAFGKARLADSAGLPRHALSILQRSNYGEFGVQGAVIEVHLLFYAGYVHEAQGWLEPAQESVMGRFNYQSLQALAAAALGDYAAADTALQRLQPTTVDLPDLGLTKVSPRTAVGLLFSQQVLQGASLLPAACRESPGTLRERLTELAAVPRQQAEAETLRGLLALECGNTAAAGQHLRAALAVWGGDDDAATIARHYLALLQRSSRGAPSRTVQ